MLNVDRAVVRMFTHELITVRWETRIADRRGLELKVYGPGALRARIRSRMRSRSWSIRFSLKSNSSRTGTTC